MKLLAKLLIRWLPLAFLVTFTCGLVYVTVHQNYRQTANDPQIQISGDVTAALVSGAPPDRMAPATKVDMARTLSPFLIVFDDSGKVVATSVVLDGKDPVVPAGIFSDAKSRGELRFTWQPKDDVRAAVVVRYYKTANSSGFVLVGRSLKEIEKRNSVLAFHIFLAFVAGQLASLVLALILTKLEASKPRR